MRRIFSFILALTLILFLAACGAPASKPGATSAPVAEKVAVPITAEHYFRHIAGGERVSCKGSPYSNTESDGSFVLPSNYVDGTPYSFNDILFDPAMFTGESVTTRRDGDGAPGSGSTSHKWVFTPIAEGDTEIMLVTDNFADDTDECRVFNITVKEENGKLRCALNWYEDGIMGVHYELCEFTDAVPTDEYERAVWCGFLPEDLSNADPDATVVTWAQYCGMLGKMIAEYDETLLPAWEEMTANAPDTEMKRDGAMVSLLCTAEFMGYDSFNADYPNAFQTYAQRVWDNVTLDYPVFDWNTPIDLGDGCADNNHVGPSYDFCLRRVSYQTGKSLLEFDDMSDFRLEQPLTLREATLSVIRLYESERIILTAEEAKENTVSADALISAQTMPAVSADSIPSWRGTSIAICDMLPVHGRLFVAEEDIAAFAEMGFNYIRLMLLWPDYAEVSDDGALLFYADTLQNIDRIIEWCAKYQIHLCIDMHELPGCGFTDRTVIENPETRAQSISVWDVFSARYADVPASLLSYNLINEPDGYYFRDGAYAAFAGELITAIRANDHTEKLIVSDGLGGECMWSDGGAFWPCEGLPADVMQTLHLYPWNANVPSGYISLQNWPYEHADAINNYVKADEVFTISGSFPAGTVLTLHLDTVYGSEGDGPIVCTADGAQIGSRERVFTVGEDNCIIIDEHGAQFDTCDNQGLVLSFTTPTDCTELVIGSDFCMTDIFIRIPADTENVYPVPDNSKENGCIYERGKYTTFYVHTAAAWSERASAIAIAADGSYTVDHPADMDVFDMESLRAYIEVWAEWSAKTGTPIMCNEFGVPLSLPEEARVSYMRSVIELFNEYGIPWCIYTNGLRCWTPVVCQADAEAGNTILPGDGSVTQKGGAWYDEPMLALFREYMN